MAQMRTRCRARLNPSRAAPIAAAATLKEGLLLLDVRPEEDFEKSHAAGAVNVPLYVPLSGWVSWLGARVKVFWSDRLKSSRRVLGSLNIPLLQTLTQ